MALDINGTDGSGTVSNFSVNDTRFTINSSGFLRNASAIGVILINLNVTISASDGLTNSTFFFVNITQAIGEIETLVDGTRLDATINNNTIISLNASIITGTGVIALFNNQSLINNGTSPIGNLTTFNRVGLYNITSVLQGNINFTEDRETWSVTVIIPVVAGNVTGVARALCRSRKLGYFNPNLPVLREAGCI